jgi:Putative beta-barrel porin-2, OmpL-like. bbp2
MARLSKKDYPAGLLALCLASGLAIPSSADAAEPILPSLALAVALATETAAAEPAQEPEPVAEETAEEAAGLLPGVDISGEVSVGYTTAIDADSSILFGRVFDNQAEQFTLHQAEIWFERASSQESPFGFNLDIVAGDDAEKIHSAGLGDSSDSFDLTQAYVTYQLPGAERLTLKAGKFVTLHGSEVIRRSGNYHYSRSLLFGYAIPFTHTGLMATYAGDVVTLTGGVVNGWDNTDDNNEDKSLHAMAGFAPAEAVSFSIGGTYGAEGAESSSKRSLIDAIVTFKPTDGLTIMFNYDWAEEEDAALDGDANWDGLAGYISFDVTDAVSLGARAEYFNDDDGVRLGAGELELWEATFTARFKLHDNLVASLELRHDESSDGELVFDDFTDDSQDTVALEVTGSF